MKFKYFLIAATFLAATIASCKKDSNSTPPAPEGQEGTPASLKISISRPAAGTYAPADANAKSAETELKTADVFIYDGTTGSLAKHVNLTATDFTYNGGTGSQDLYTCNATITTTTGPKRIYVGLNLPTDVANKILAPGTISGISALNRIADDPTTYLSNVTTGWAMFSKNVTAATLTENPADPANNISVEVARLVAKVSIEKGTTLGSESIPVTGGKITKLFYGIANSNRGFYPFQLIESGIVKDFNWADGSYVSTDFSIIPPLYVPVNPAGMQAAQLITLYTPENTSEKHYAQEVTYASVRAAFIPDSIKVFTNGTDNTAGYSDVINPSAVAATFYKISPTDDKPAFFSDLSVAKKYQDDHVGSGLSTYADGYCYYSLFLNPRGGFSTLRNNFYRMTITKIVGLGHSSPEPTNPTDPVGVPTNITATVEIAPWTLVSDDVELVP